MDFNIKSLRINVLLNAIKQCCSIFFPLITFSYVSRVLGQKALGDYSFSLSYVSYFLLVAGLGINSYAVREGARLRSSEKFSQFFNEIFSINIISTCVAYGLMILIMWLVPQINEHSIQIFILSIGILLTTIGCDWINVIFEDYYYITIRYIIIQILSLSMVFSFVRNPYDLNKYCFIYVFATYGGLLLNIHYIRKKTSFRIKPSFNRDHLKPLFILFANSIATVIYVNSDITILGLFRNGQIGIYSLSSKIYNSIKQVLNATVMVTVPRLSSISLENSKLYSEYLKKIFAGICLVLIPIAAGMIALRKQIIFILGGEEFLDGTTSFLILSIGMIFAILSSIISNDIVIINRKERYALVSTTLSGALNLLLNIVAIPLLGINGAALTTALAEIVNFAVLIYYSRRVISLKCLIPNNITAYILESTIILVLGSLLQLLEIKLSVLSALIEIIAVVSISVLSYSIILYITKDNVYEYLLNIIRKVMCRKMKQG